MIFTNSYEGLTTSIAKACKPWSMKSRTASYTSLWQVTRLCDVKKGEAIVTLKWVPKSVPFEPMCPA